MTITKEQIIAEVNELKAMFHNCNSAEDAKVVAIKNKLSVACGDGWKFEESVKLDPRISEEDIEYFKVQEFQNLGDVYIYKCGDITFDVYEDGDCDPCLKDVSVETL